MKRYQMPSIGPAGPGLATAQTTRGGLFWLRLNIALAACAAASLLLLALIGMGGI